MAAPKYFAASLFSCLLAAHLGCTVAAPHAFLSDRCGRSGGACGDSSQPQISQHEETQVSDLGEGLSLPRVARKLQQLDASQRPSADYQPSWSLGSDAVAPAPGPESHSLKSSTDETPSLGPLPATPSPTLPVQESPAGASSSPATGASPGSGSGGSDSGSESPSNSQPWRAGRGTVRYSTGITNFGAASMSCGMAYVNDHFKDNHVAVSSSLFGSGALCGACLRVRCDQDIGCTWGEGLDNGTAGSGGGNSTMFMVVDLCDQCEDDDVVLSARGFVTLSGLNYNLYPQIFVEWQFTSCAPLIQGKIRMMPSQQISPSFLGLNFSNTKQRIRGVLIGGIRMAPTDYGYWVIDTPGKRIPLQPPYQLSLLGEAGQVLTTQLASLRPQVLDLQFDSP